MQDDDKFIILASDGIWEFLSSEQCVRIVSGYWEAGNPEGACERLVKESVAIWRREDEVIDDITVVIIFLSMLV
jgi:serine/threonine protein phosphatase PrpC